MIIHKCFLLINRFILSLCLCFGFGFGFVSDLRTLACLTCLGIMDPTENFMEELTEQEVHDMMKVIPNGIPLILEDLYEIFSQEDP